MGVSQPTNHRSRNQTPRIIDQTAYTHLMIPKITVKKDITLQNMYTLVIQSPINGLGRNSLAAAQMPPVAVGMPSKKRLEGCFS